MRKSNLLRFSAVAIAIICCAVNSGCDVASKPKTASKNQPDKPAEAAQVADENLKVQDRETEDAGQLLEQIVSQRNVNDEQSDQENSRESENANNDELTHDSDVQPEKQTIEIPATWKRLGKKEEIWIDTDAKEVIIAGRVCLNQGALEMFICPEHTKEHESIIAANATALQVHLALTALGADPGKPTSWDPEYRAAFGPTIKVTLKWMDQETQKVKTVLANQWIRDLKTKKAMEHLWVFGGSQFWEDPDSKEQIYYGDAGELICLSNFSTATIDLNVESSQSNDGLLFEAFTENIPPLGTKVYAIIKPGKRIEPDLKPAEKADPQVANVSESAKDKPQSVEPKNDDKIKREP